jgi:peptidoglycan/LPS O-acetylase OafA/YrhL
MASAMSYCSPSASGRREFDIDFFRGWVCLSLMTLHFYNSDLYTTFFSLFGETGKYVVWNIRLGVESFFVLAGFMMAHMLRPIPGEDVSLFGYLKKRFFRLILPYWIAVLIFTAYRWAVRLILHAATLPPSPGDVVAQLCLVQEFFIPPAQLEKIGPVGYWSMVTLEQFYLLWLFLYSICLFVFWQNRGKGYARAEYTMFCVTSIAFAGSLSLWVWNDGFLPGTHFGWHMTAGHLYVLHDGMRFPIQVPLYSAFLGLGMLLYWSIRQRIFRPYFWIALVLLFAAAVDANVSLLWKSVLTALIFIPLARGARLPDCAVLRLLAYCGKRSYSIYLIHPIVGVAFISLTWRLTAKSEWLAFPLVLLAMVLSVAGALVFYKYVELPFQAKSRNVEYRKKRGAAVQTVVPAVEIESMQTA